MPYDPTIDRSIPQATPQGELIPTPPTLDQQRWELLLKDPSFRDRLMGGAETAAMVGTSPIGYLAGILGAGYGTVTGQDPREIGAKWEHASIYQPQTPVGQYYGEQVGEKLSALPPVISGIPHLSMGPKAGRFAAETYAKPVAEMAAELYAAGQLPGTINPASYIVKPEGNLNFTPTIRADMLKGPETQPVSSFLNQLPSLQGLTATGLEHGLEKLRALDPNEKITKTALEDQLSPSQYKKVDLQGLSNAGIEHYFDQALENMDPHDVLHNMGLPQNLHSAAQDFLGGNVDHPPAALRPFLRRNGWLDREVFEDNFFQSERDLAHEQARDFAEADGPSRDYRDAQRLVDPDYTEDTYFEIGVKDPRYEGTYRHYEGAPQGTIGHVRGSFLPEPYMDERVAIEGTSLHNFGINDPGAMLIEEIQSDANKGVKQTGPLHQVHGVLFKAAVQHALENGATTVYMPTSKLIANVRNRPSSDYAPIYDQQIVKEGINPLKKIPGVTVTKMFDDGGENHVMHKIDFAPEAVEYILRGEGQKLPGYADGGQVEKDDAPPEGYRYVYFGDPTQGTSGRYPVPIETPAAEPNRDVIGTSAAPSLPTTAPELQPEPSRDIVPHRYVAGEVPGGPAPEPTLDQMRYELARKNLTPADWLMGGAENVASLLTGLPGMLGGYAGLAYHGLRGAPFKEANEKAADWARATSYQPTTLAGQEIAEDYVHPFLAKLPPVISGIMPGLMRAPKGTTGALTAGVKRDIGQFSNDVFNAQHGITPGYPTMGSEFQKAFVEPRPNVYEMLTGIEPSNVPSTASAAVKHGGGYWIPPESTGSVERFLSPLKLSQDAATAMLQGFDAPDQHVSNWVEKRLTPYVKNQMGTPKDPVRLQAEDTILENGQRVPGVLHVPNEALGAHSSGRAAQRVAQGFPPEGFGKSQRAKDWEDASDYVIKTERADQTVHAPEWTKTLKSDALVNRISSYNSPSVLGFDHLIDELRNATAADDSLPKSLHIKPVNLERMTVPEAILRVAKINEWREATRVQAALESQKNIVVHKVYDDGHRWVQLTKPGEFAMESDAMGHSVRGYEPEQGSPDWIKQSGTSGAKHYGHGGWDAIKSGAAKVYSLRDPQGASLVTIETKRGDLDRAIGALSQEEKNLLKQQAAEQIGIDPNMVEPLSDREFSVLMKAMDNIYRAKYGEPPFQVTQIKGAGNAQIPKGFARDYVKDFLNSSNFSGVKDAHMAGLIDTSMPIALESKLADLGLPLSAENVQASLPRFVTEDDLAGLLIPKNNAEGGIIHMADGGQPKPLSYMENKSAPFGEYRRGIGMKKGTLNKFEGGAVTDTLDKMVKNPQASTLLNLDLPNIVAAKQQAQPLKRGGTVKFSNNIDDMRYALTRRQG